MGGEGGEDLEEEQSHAVGSFSGEALDDRDGGVFTVGVLIGLSAWVIKGLALAGHPVGGFLYDCAPASGGWARGYFAY
jgi:hypothetical protein